jgi:hypothetical protein
MHFTIEDLEKSDVLRVGGIDLYAELPSVLNRNEEMGEAPTALLS